MSREFRDVYGCGYLHSVLANVEPTEGRHRITHALGRVYAALAPLEYASASYEACDSGPDRPVLALQEHGLELNAAVEALLEIRDEDKAVIKTQLKHYVQDRLLGALANELSEEATETLSDDERTELRRQAHRVMKLFGVDAYPGLGELDA